MELPAEELSSTPGRLPAAPGLSGWVLPRDGFAQSTAGSRQYYSTMQRGAQNVLAPWLHGRAGCKCPLPC